MSASTVRKTSTVKYVICLTAFIGTSFATPNDDCSREKSRTVRNVVYQDILPQYKSVGAKVPWQCPFYRARDRYLQQEEHKERDSLTHWSCGYCGKAFIGEIYLDGHLSLRHATTIYTEPDSVCLADYCEIFRCDVLAGIAKATFWDVALCMDDDMIDLSQDCQELLSACIPESLSWNATKRLTALLEEKVCSYLTCKAYWNNPAAVEKEPPRPSYVIFTVLLSVGIVIYYFVAASYFWTDTFSDVYDSDEYIGRNPDTLSNVDVERRGGAAERTKMNTGVTGQKTRSRPKQSIIHTEAAAKQDIFNVESLSTVASAQTHEDDGR